MNHPLGKSKTAAVLSFLKVNLISFAALASPCLLPDNPGALTVQAHSGSLRSLLPSSAKFSRGGVSSWKLISSGEESVDVPVRQRFVSALPAQFQCWSQLGGWSVGVHEFEVGGKSVWKGTHWKLAFRVTFAYGNAKGLQLPRQGKTKNQTIRGSYLGYLTVTPILTSKGPRGRRDVKSDLNSDVRILGVYNSGDDRDPVATVDLLVSYGETGRNETFLIQVNALGGVEQIKAGTPGGG